MKLLLVDDEHHVIEWLEQLFQSTGLFEVYKAYSGSEALRIIQDQPIAIMVSDIKMPGITGFELAERVFANWPHCHVLFLSGYASFDYVYRANRRNVKYLLKTEDDDVIMDAVLREKRAIEEELAQPDPIDADLSGEPKMFGAALGAALDARDIQHIKAVFDALIMHYEGQRMTEPHAMAEYQYALSGVVSRFSQTIPAQRLSKLMQPDQIDGWAEAFGCLEQAVLIVLHASELETEDHHHLANRITRFIKEHLGEDLSLAHIARSVAYNPSYISRVYRQVTGENISVCVKRTRIEFAKKCLLETDLSVQDIAVKTGFESPQYFSTVFRAYTGYAPLEYRKVFL